MLRFLIKPDNHKIYSITANTELNRRANKINTQILQVVINLKPINLNQS